MQAAVDDLRVQMSQQLRNGGGEAARAKHVGRVANCHRVTRVQLLLDPGHAFFGTQPAWRRTACTTATRLVLGRH